MAIREHDSIVFSESGTTLAREASVDECASTLTRTDGHRVPACSTDTDCPLQGALACDNGYCCLPE